MPNSDGLDVLCMIGARGGSKGLPGKNIKPLAGKPLIAYPIQLWKEWGKSDQIVVATDSPDIAEVARKHGASVPELLPAEYCTDTAPQLPALAYMLKRINEKRGKPYDVVMLLPCTTPLKTVADVDAVYKLFLANRGKVDMVTTAYESVKSPYFNMRELDRDGYAVISKTVPGMPPGAIARRQDAPIVYQMNDCVYAFEPGFLLEARSTTQAKMKLVVMPQERSVDIDTAMDFTIAEILIKERENARWSKEQPRIAGK